MCVCVCVCVCVCLGGLGREEKEECICMRKCEEKKEKGECKGSRLLVSVVNNAGV